MNVKVRVLATGEVRSLDGRTKTLSAAHDARAALELSRTFDGGAPLSACDPGAAVFVQSDDTAANATGFIWWRSEVIRG